MKRQLAARRTNAAVEEQRIVFGLVAAAGLVSGIAFTGWLVDVPVLQGFGITGRPIWPLAALGYLFLIGGFTATLLGRRRAPLLLAIPILIALFALAGQGGGLPGIDGPLPGDPLARIPTGFRSLPTANSIVAFAFLGTALLLTAHRDNASAGFANLLAAASLCVGLFSMVLLFVIIPARDTVTQILVAPFPAALANILLASAFLFWRQGTRWNPFRARNRLRWPVVGLVVLLPILPVVVARCVPTMLPVSPLATDLIAILFNVGVVGLLVWLSVDRLAHQQAKSQEIASALDVAAIVLTRPSGEIVHWSRGCELLYGWSAIEAIGRQKKDLLRPRSVGANATEMSGAPSVGEIDLSVRCRDGSRIRVLQRTQVVERPDREALFVVKMLDISDRVRAEEALRESEARFAIAAEAQRLGVSHWDIASGRLEWSPGSEQRLGLEPGSLSSFAQWEALIEPEDTKGVMDSVARATANHDERITFQYRFRQPSGAMRTIEGSARLIYHENGELAAVIAANIDVTERQEREAAQQLQSIIDVVPDATIVFNLAGTIRSFSAAAERMFGCDGATAIGSDVKLLIPEVIAAAHGQSIVHPLDPGQLDLGQRHASGLARELTARRVDGSSFPVELNVGEAWFGGERMFTGVIRDISDRHATERRMGELNAELAHISRQSAMSEVAADLAHELNQPLSATANFLASARMLIERGEDSARVADLIKMGEDQTLRSGEIIRRLRDFLTNNETEMRAESLANTVREAVELVLFGTAQFGIKLRYRLDPAADMVFADRIQIQQVMVNLLRNAVDALRGQPTGAREIVIASRRVADGMNELSVSDNGPGLPKSIGGELYSRFATTKSGSAMGIGLSISRRIVEAHGGKLVAMDRAGGGAEFRFTLPALEELEELEG
ncbi:PAS domain S-box protein [Sphingomonas sp. So64.6b]|uniref:PAS domain-containing sensor histidine kinase n=1 Tax=Sphingomonas sp. So64.6b TaxID=2997354 RepID=UPI0016014B36|nr:PAS domain S-box protein [Sphingomonas sp. So64.6b]QNA85347.1 PAS domain S-box protein [Sphingomonas sp. So64.6b]